MLYFLLEVIVFLALLSPDSHGDSVDRQKAGLEKVRNSGKDQQGKVKVVSSDLCLMRSCD